MVDLLEERGVQGATVLEIGGGVGEIGLELLRRGAGSATNLEISPGYEEEAAALIAEAGMGGRVHRRLVDIAADPGSVRPADVVVAHRVVCCYPDHPRLLGSAADDARRQLVFSFPPRNSVTLSVVGTQNGLFRLVRREYRAFAHPPAAMLGVLADHGLRPAVVHRGPVWQVATGER